MSACVSQASQYGQAEWWRWSLTGHALLQRGQTHWVQVLVGLAFGTPTYPYRFAIPENRG